MGAAGFKRAKTTATATTNANATAKTNAGVVRCAQNDKSFSA
jgi:hypothetical protein